MLYVTRLHIKKIVNLTNCIEFLINIRINNYQLIIRKNYAERWPSAINCFYILHSILLKYRSVKVSNPRVKVNNTCIVIAKFDMVVTNS